jgi:type IV pilus assembly protein PilB
VSHMTNSSSKDQPSSAPAKSAYFSPACGRLAQMLVAEAALSRSDLHVAAEYSERERMPLSDAIIDLGFIHEADTYAMLAKATGMELVDLSSLTPSELALRLVPERVARRHRLLPLYEDNRMLTYVIARAYHDEAERDVSFASGRKPHAVLAPRSDLRAALERHYDKLGDLDLLVSRVRSAAHIEILDAGEAAVPTQSPVIELCNHIIARAVDAGASDIHIEPTQTGLVVRYRLGGILGMVMTVPTEAMAAIRNRYKVMARVDISVRHRPQDGAFRLRVNEHAIDVRLSTLPTINGEKIVLRVIDTRNEPKGIESLGYDDASLALLRRALERPDGLVLVTGPTGSGKTTVLYSALHHLRSGRTNIISVEDPVERQIDGVNQIPVNNRTGSGFAAILRSVLRQDPNVIMVGEIRDSEVAQIVGQAAYTGHQVLSSLHTADAVGAVTRLLNLGLEPFKVAESLTAIVGQRLLRKLCPQCRKRNNAREAQELGVEHGLPSVPMSAGAGCDNCRFTGYVDRVPVAEVMVPDDEIRATICRGGTTAEIRAVMHAGGFHSMRDRALNLVMEGVTSIEEVNRVLAPDSVPATVAKPAAPGSKGRVLVVDDDRVTRMLVKLLCEREGYDVIEGENGRAGVELAMREHPDLLVVDLLMPEMDGYQTIEQIRKDPLLSLLPVMVLTAESGPGIEQRVLDLGADDYLMKPFEPALLLSRIRAAFRRSHRAAA